MDLTICGGSYESRENNKINGKRIIKAWKG